MEFPSNPVGFFIKLGLVRGKALGVLGVELGPAFWDEFGPKCLRINEIQYINVNEKFSSISIITTTCNANVN